MRASAVSFSLQVGMEIDLGRLHRLVSQPQGDHGLIDAMLQQLHGGAVPQDVRAHRFGQQAMGATGRRFRHGGGPGVRERPG